jgi:hypothetical protein
MPSVSRNHIDVEIKEGDNVEWRFTGSMARRRQNRSIEHGRCHGYAREILMKYCTNMRRKE